MKVITVKQNQTIFDLAIENYGSCEAISEILNNNPNIRNDKTALTALGINYLTDGAFYLDAPVEPGFELQVNPDSQFIKTSVTKEITNEVTTFNL